MIYTAEELIYCIFFSKEKKVL